MRMRHIVICVLPHSTIFFHIFYERQDFREKKVLNKNVCLNFLYNFVWNNSRSTKKFASYDKKNMYIGRHAMYP
jgi:hypothetical protein